MIPGTHMTAHFRQIVADISLKHKTLQEAIDSLPKAENLQQEMTRNVLISFLEDEYKVTA